MMHLPYFFLILIVFADLPVCSFSADYDSRFLECSRYISCGNVYHPVEINYPFWGNGRPEYCGLPGYELRCKDDVVLIDIQSQQFRVYDSYSRRLNSLRIATMDVHWNENCPSRFVNVSLPSNLFRYFPTVTQTVNLYYGCPRIQQLVNTNKLSCSLSTENYFWLHDSGTPPPGELSRCNVTVVVPVRKDGVKWLLNSVYTLKQLVRGGFEVEYFINATFCNDCERSGGKCGRDGNTSQNICLCYDGAYPDRCATKRPREVLQSSSRIRKKIIKMAIIGLGATLGMMFIILLFIVLWKKGDSLINDLLYWNKNKKAQRLVEMFLENCGSMAPNRYSYAEIKKMTNTFKDKIGQGGFGGVYKGKLLDGRLVAVKLLKRTSGDGEDFINEVASISRTSHVNIVSLLGFSFDGSKRALVYDFMANGSLEKFIYDQSIKETHAYLEWETLYKIVIGVARGLEYLHRGCSTRILHFDIKPHNILLDEDFTPKISDFGLAKICPRNESIISMSNARGTVGYIAPEVFSRNFGGVSHKSDVYSYGMMVLEIVGRRKNIDVRVDHTSEIYFPHWIHQRIELDEDLGLHGVTSNEDEEVMKKMILVALWCIQTNPVDRPSMTKVVEMLDGRPELLSTPPKPYPCSIKKHI